jgi:hypothetical protein
MRLRSSTGLASELRCTVAESTGVASGCSDYSERGVNTIAEEIARYLRDHPDAADSLEGIRQWWLPRLRLQEAPAQIEGALAELVEKGLVVRQSMPDGTVLYRRAETDEPER